MVLKASLVTAVAIIGLYVFAQVKMVLNPMIEGHNDKLATYASLINTPEAP